MVELLILSSFYLFWKIEKKRQKESRRVARCLRRVADRLFACFRKVSIAGNTINDAELALAIPVYERSPAIRAALVEISVGVALALFLPNRPTVTFGAKAQAERVFLIIITERGAAPDAQHTLGPLVLLF